MCAILLVEGARAAFFRASRRFSCFFDFANFQDMAWMTLARIRRTFFRAGLGRSVKHSTSGGRDMVIGDGFGIIGQVCLHFAASDGPAPQTPTVVPRGAEKNRLPTSLATCNWKVAAFRQDYPEILSQLRGGAHLVCWEICVFCLMRLNSS